VKLAFRQAGLMPTSRLDVRPPFEDGRIIRWANTLTGPARPGFCASIYCTDTVFCRGRLPVELPTGADFCFITSHLIAHAEAEWPFSASTPPARGRPDRGSGQE